MLIDDYIHYTDKYNKIYDKSVVLMQVGSFYELYGLNNNEGADVDEICRILEIKCTKKNSSVNEISKKNPKMAGIPLYVLDKYVDILYENGYTIILVEQVTPPPEPKREVTKILSPGTSSNETTYENNYLMSLYFSTGSYKNNKFIIGFISYIDVNTNNSYIYETTQNDTKLNLEEIYSTIANNKPSEIVIFTDQNSKKNEDFINTLDKFVKQIPVNCVHNKLNALINDNFFKLNYQTAVLQKVFKNTGLYDVIDYLKLEYHPFSVVNYTYLLQFIYEHNEKMLIGLNKPVFLENTKKLTLVNNVVSNLNIIKTINGNSKTSSVLNLLNNCKTSMGKRYFKDCLLNPIIDTDDISKRYKHCEYFMDNKLYERCNMFLNKIVDIERMFKKIIMKSIQPYDFVNINTSVESIIGLYEELINNNCNFEDLKWSSDLQKKLVNLYDYLKNKFNFEVIEKISLTQISKNIFNIGVYPEIDDIQKQINILENIFENVCLSLNEWNENNTEFKLEVSKNKDKVSRKIVVTKNRFDNIFKDNVRYLKIEKYLTDKCNLSWKDIKSEPVTANNKTSLKIVFKDMDISQIKLLDLQNKFRERIIEFYNIELEYIYETFGDIFDSAIKFISNIDFYCNNARNAIEKCYCKPVITNDENSFISAKKMRHPLIEAIQTDIPYIANDIEIGVETQRGILLYGINSVGKSSLMKSVGINLILAQAGMYVSCESFTFSPYDHIFTRVPSGDNLFKSQSTFVTEINDLRTILKRSTNRSLVIGDELASGTEHISAISIVASGILNLSKKNTSFIFATHLHELCDLDCIKKLDNLKIFHLSVQFDKENDCLLFDRILKEGNGNTLYGLEIARSLDLPPEFLLQANEIRQQYTEMNEYIVKPKISKYNDFVFMDTCSVCNKNCEEVHHIEEQQFADENGILKTSFIHKNRKSNLITVCKECHDNVHNKNIEISGYIQTDKGKKLNIEHKPCDIDYESIKKRCIELRNTGKSYVKVLEIIKSEFKLEITLYKIKQLLK